MSPRAGAPVVAVNCGAIPRNLLESELFGHRRGLSPAHRDKPGLFEQPRGGTLFLDEIGELALELQVKLLRILQEKEVRRLGDVADIRVDVRVVAAISRNFDAMVESGAFRRDLFYRINVVCIDAPALRARKDDILPLARRFTAWMNARLGTQITGFADSVADVPLAYDWPGTVRELENVLEHAVVLADGEVIEPAALPERLRRGQMRATTPVTLELPRKSLSVKEAQRAMERELIQRALERTGGNRTYAARLLELSPVRCSTRSESMG